MIARAPAIVLLAIAASSCSTYRTTFHSGAPVDPRQPEHSRGSRAFIGNIVDVNRDFDLGAQCPPHGWAELDIHESPLGDNIVWRCAK